MDASLGAGAVVEMKLGECELLGVGPVMEKVPGLARGLQVSVRKLHPRNFGSGSYVLSSAKLHRKFHLLNRAVGTYGSVRCRAAPNRAIFKLSCECFCRFATLKRFNQASSTAAASHIDLCDDEIED